MGHWKHKTILFALIFTASLCYSNGCFVVRDEDVSPFGIPHAFILDEFRGTFWQNLTAGIVDIDPTATDGRGYYNIQIVDSRFVLSTTDLYKEYEEREVAEQLSITTRFRCTDGSDSATFTVWVNVRDTNNNPPTFLLPPEGEFFFTIAAPVPPGYEITGCLNDLIVRDIDLTTEKIIFEIEENPYFEIEREIPASHDTPKEFSAIIRTKTFIRSIPQPIRLKISATDQDRTDQAPRTKTAYINVIGNSEFALPEEPVFSETIYLADYTEDDRVVLTAPISLRNGYDELVKFDIKGEFSANFVLESNPDKENERSIRVDTPLEGDVLRERNIHLIVTAEREHTSGASATVVVRLPEVVPLEFQRAHYEGTIENNNARSPQLILSQGYAGATVTATVRNDHSSYFTASVERNVVTLSMRPLDESIIEENSYLNLEVVATNGLSTATTVVTLEIIKDDNITPVFNKAIYTGVYDPAEFTIDEIVLIQGHDGIDAVELYGEHKDYFRARLTGTTVTIEVPEPIPLELYSRERIVLSLEVRKPRTVGASAAIIINLPADSQTGHDVSFGRYLYQGVIDLDDVRHEAITLTGFDGTTVEILGDYNDLFESHVSGAGVEVQARRPLTLPSGVTIVALELRAGPAGTALLLRVLDQDGPTVPTVPTVTFSSESYVVSVDTIQIGLVGRVSATTDTGEKLTYSLGTDDAHLQTRLSINNEGELYLSDPTNSGVYTFQVIATTVESGATGTATVHLTVQAITECDDNGIGMDPLIILDRDEELPHTNLVELDPTLHAGCHYTLTNRWPIDQTWLYVNENGLHTLPIDREHASIAYMPLSQVQVELTLHCEGDSATREKLSERTERLGNYGNNKWILTDTIVYNARRSLVNLIVNDINDNNPIFVGKENEPIAVGYPTDELAERILPRSLAELKATDADIGENAALRYWSSESVLAVAPTTGFVHVRYGAQLRHDQVLTVTATDRNGDGLSGTIQLVVKLLNMNHIAVVTIRNAFLDDEMTILARLSDAVGYEVKTLRSVVISDDINEHATRNKRETGAPRASLQLYVYGINEREPVAVDRLSADITTNAATANVASTIPLEDHLQDMNSLDQIGLLVATIILSILLFAVMLLVAIWFFLRWRKNKNYDELNEENSLASRNASLGELPQPEVVKPRLNIEDLKRSEKRLQQMLHAPIEEVTVEPVPKKLEAPVEAILDLPIAEPSAPIVIQSIDKLKDAEESSDDEFGEVSAKPRKSVVTFNENVEKIIHVEDNADDDSDIDDVASVTANVDASNSGLEIYRL